MKAELNVAEVSAWVLVNVITSRVVPFELMLEGLKLLPTVGRLGVTVSTSATVQVPDPQPAPVFVTPEGTEIVAVLVTCVCANAGAGASCSARNSKANRPTKRPPANPSSQQNH